MMNIGKKLISYRQHNRLSQEELSLKMHVSRQTISNWETGRTYPDIQSLLLLAELYHVTVDDLVKEDVKKMEDKLTQLKIRWLMIGIATSIILNYLAFASIRWIPIGIVCMLVGTFTTIGVIMIYFYVKLTRSLQLRTFKQILNYINDRPVSRVPKPSTTSTIVKTVIATLGGLLTGGLITWLIIVYLL